MEISKKDLTAAFEKSGLNPQEAEKVWTTLEARKTPKFDFSNWLYYLGAFVIISAMTWALNLSWEWFSGGAILFLSSIYAFIFYSSGKVLWKKPNLRTPAGLLITIAVCMTPLIIYGMGTYLQMIPKDGESLFSVRMAMEFGTILAGLIALRFYPFPFLTAPIFFATWLFFNDLTTQFIVHENAWKLSVWTALIFGLGMIATAYVIEKRVGKDYAFWAYLFGALLFWFSLSDLMSTQSESVLILYLILNIFLMILSIFLQETIFMILGAIGTFIYLGHLAYTIFGDTILFPIALCTIGLLLIYGGILFQRNKGVLK